tara:strand:+ start:7808 stop:8449 length:642 start_codon:yes stop_codon:yes gene_type:complete
MSFLPATCIILAGGKSRRMGMDKRFLEVGGQGMLARIIAICETLFDDIVIVTAIPESTIQTRHRVVHDLVKNCATLGGIYTGLSYASLNYGFVVACDMPWVQPDLVKFIVERVEEPKETNYDVVIPKLQSGLQPTHAVYSKRCLPFLKKMIDQRDFRVTRICDYDSVSVRYICDDEIEKFDPSGRAFENVNTVEDLKNARGGEDTNWSPRGTQ